MQLRAIYCVPIFLCVFAPILSSICMLPFVNSEFVTNKRFFLLTAWFFHSFVLFFCLLVFVDMACTLYSYFWSCVSYTNVLPTTMPFIPSLFFRLTSSSSTLDFPFSYIKSMSRVCCYSLLSFYHSFWNFPSWTFLLLFRLHECMQSALLIFSLAQTERLLFFPRNWWRRIWRKE